MENVMTDRMMLGWMFVGLVVTLLYIGYGPKRK
jgi:hypothetical protein